MIARGLLLATCVAAAACAPRPASFRYDPGRVVGPKFDGRLAIVGPLDDRYAAERKGETFTRRYGMAFIGVAYGKHRGNQITGNDNFVTVDGPFGRQGIAATVGNLLVAGLQRDTGDVVTALPSALDWRCSDGTCVPSAQSVVAVGRATGARYVLATRIAHLYGGRFGERTFLAASYTEKRGTTVYRVTETADTRSYSTSFGNAVIELSLFEVGNGQIVRASRRTYTGIRTRETGSSAEARTMMAEVAVEALGATIDAIRVTMRGPAPPPAPPSSPEPSPPEPTPP